MEIATNPQQVAAALKRLTHDDYPDDPPNLEHHVLNARQQTDLEIVADFLVDLVRGADGGLSAGKDLAYLHTLRTYFNLPGIEKAAFCSFITDHDGDELPRVERLYTWQSPQQSGDRVPLCPKHADELLARLTGTQMTLWKVEPVEA